jgi:exopolysaccharide biosynthesis polyprenyl glycosylphosphotransferase
MDEQSIAREQIVSTLTDLPDYLCEKEVDEVAIFYPLRSHYDQIREVVSICEQHGIIIRMRTNMFELSLGKSLVDYIMEEPLITIYTGNMNNRGWKMVAKYVLDFYLSLIMLIILLPLLLMVAILIKLDSKGPVFFRQERIGLAKTRYRMYKFRTMSVDAEQRIKDLEHLNEADGAAFKIKDDPRITRLGKWLRKTSIDELPQLINVLIGDMSLVGPRPLPVRDYKQFNTHWHRRRFSVKPGITCLWQISGRSDLSFEQWMQLDMDYIDKWSLTLDFKILLRTMFTIITGHGAY